MKPNYRILLAAAIFAIGASATYADIAASPKVRQMLDERRAVATASARPDQAVTPKHCCEPQNLALSPKARQALNDRVNCCAPSGKDQALRGSLPGIAASPKLQEQLAGRE